MVARLIPSGRHLLIRQYRAPCDAYVLEFPAGLIDPGEQAKQTAVRELHEETGYVGTVRDVSPLIISSAGFSREGFHFVTMDIDESDPRNTRPEQQCEHGEDIEVVVATLDGMPAMVRRHRAAGDLLDSRVAAYFLGMGVTIW
jgi:8-oxo-dGTP pyrophosphatase MutT (NUDIX family)